MFQPAAWISVEAWPTMVMRIPGTCASGTAGDTGTVSGQRAAPPASFHRKMARSPPSGTDCPGLKKRVPSKWSVGGPW